MRINVMADSITSVLFGWNLIILLHIPSPHLLWKANWILWKKIQCKPEHIQNQPLPLLLKTEGLLLATKASLLLCLHCTVYSIKVQFQGLRETQMARAWLLWRIYAPARKQFLRLTSSRIPFSIHWQRCSWRAPQPLNELDVLFWRSPSKRGVWVLILLPSPCGLWESLGRSSLLQGPFPPLLPTTLFPLLRLQLLGNSAKKTASNGLHPTLPTTIFS